MIFFEIIGKIQWYLIGFLCCAGLFYQLSISRDAAKKKSKDNEEHNQQTFTLWTIITIACIAILIMGNVVPRLAQKGGGEVEDVLNMKSPQTTISDTNDSVVVAASRTTLTVVLTESAA